MADRRMTVLARLTLTALRSALLVGLPSITEILGRLDSRPHSLDAKRNNVYCRYFIRFIYVSTFP